MVQQVCGACGGNNPHCDVCKGSGRDRPAPEGTVLDAMAHGDLTEQEIVAEINTMLDHAQKAFDARITIMLMGLRAAFYGMVLMSGVATLALTFISFLIGFYQIGPAISMAAITVVIVAATLAMAYRVQTYDLRGYAQSRIRTEEDLAQALQELFD